MNLGAQAMVSPSLGSAQHILDLVRSGAATTRATLARATGLAASTTSARVDALLDDGILVEAGDGRSSGGRPPRLLRVRSDAGAIAAIDLGAHHAVLALLDLDGTVLRHETVAAEIATGPRAVLQMAWRRIAEVAAELPSTQPLRAVAAGVPGPVARDAGTVISPSRMPGWNGVDVAALLAEVTGLPALVENDSNVMAAGEAAVRERRTCNMIVLKAGTGIGCGVIAEGRLYRGAVGAAGDISHVRVTGDPSVVCSCGAIGCLDAVASGAALVRVLRADGVTVADTAEIARRARNGDAAVAQPLRTAGRLTGEVLATAVNFFNPDALIVGGQLSLAEPFVAGLRGVIHERCLPMAVKSLTIDTTAAGALAGVIGAGSLALDRLFAGHADDGAPLILRRA